MNLTPLPHCLVTGGAGYIGQHIVVALLREGWHVSIFDNLVTSNKPDLPTLWHLAGLEESPECQDQRLRFHKGDVRDKAQLSTYIENLDRPLTRIIHLAALKSIQESIEDPDLYREVNLGGLEAILEVADSYDIREFVFSSSAVVYQGPCPAQGYRLEDAVGFEESLTLHAYASTKRIGELLLETWADQHPEAVCVALRYFNPIGNEASGQIGERLLEGDSPNVMAQLAKTHLGLKPQFRIMGCNFETHGLEGSDGTAMRDYIDVRDLARAHIEMVSHRPGYHCYNVGVGRPTSVRTLVEAFQKAAGVTLSILETGPRPGDMPVSYAAVENRKQMMWMPRYSLEESLQSVIARCLRLRPWSPSSQSGPSYTSEG